MGQPCCCRPLEPGGQAQPPVELHAIRILGSPPEDLTQQFGADVKQRGGEGYPPLPD